MNGITTQDLLHWLDELAGRTTLLAPQARGESILYAPVRRAGDVILRSEVAARPLLPAKVALFPPTERLLEIDRRVGGDGPAREVRLRETLPSGPQVVFGVRPCDARGLRALDAVFLDRPPADPYYAARRAETALIGLACKEMGPECFCRSLGGAPDDAGDVDVMLYEAEGGYAIQAVTPRGRVLLEGVALQPLEAPIARSPIADPVPVPDTLAWPPHFNDAWWESVAAGCLGCRLCAYVCPTCRCYDVRDEPLPAASGTEAYERLRCWDSCAGDPYRRIAGGHNPRPTPGARLRNRFYCKFYYVPEQYGPTACTGCGRCIEVCPVGIDITEVLAHLVHG